MLENSRNFTYFADGSKMFHANGNIDSWCVYYEEPNKEPIALKDESYFDDAISLSKIYGSEKVYSDFVKIYDLTTGEYEDSVIKTIRNISSTYGKFQLSAEKVFTILYMAMVSEFHWVSKTGKPTIMNKRLKRLGVYQIIKLNYKPDVAAKFSRNAGASTLMKICERYGF